MRFLRPRSEHSDPRAFEELLSAHLDALYRAALRFCGGRTADAEDLLQDAALRAFEQFGALREQRAARSWLLTILVRTHLNRGRSSRRRGEVLEVDLDEQEFEQALAAWRPTPRPDAAAELAQLRERVAAALDTLDAPMREVIWLVDGEGFRQREVAEMLGVPEGTVASRLFRARRALRHALAPIADTMGEEV